MIFRRDERQTATSVAVSDTVMMNSSGGGFGQMVMPLQIMASQHVRGHLCLSRAVSRVSVASGACSHHCDRRSMFAYKSDM